MHGVKQNTLVYDPFMGTGNTALACLKLKVNYIGTDIDGEYIKVALDNVDEKKKDLGNWLEVDKGDKKIISGNKQMGSLKP